MIWIIFYCFFQFSSMFNCFLLLLFLLYCFYSLLFHVFQSRLGYTLNCIILFLFKREMFHCHPWGRIREKVLKLSNARSNYFETYISLSAGSIILTQQLASSWGSGSLIASCIEISLLGALSSQLYDTYLLASTSH